MLPGPKSLPAALALLFGVAVLSGVGWFVVWQITTHSTQLGNQLTHVVDQTKHWLQTGPLHLKSADLDKLTKNITDTIQSHQGQLISGAIATLRTVAEALAALLLILLSTFFLLRDGELIWGFVLKMFPSRAQPRLDTAGRAGWRTLGGYMRGQTLIALFHGISIAVVLLVLRVPLAAALGVLIFLGSFIPIIGLTVTGALCVAITLLEHGVTAAIVVGVSIVVLVQLEAHLLQPLIMSRSVEVHPLAIALAVITGTTLGGIPGALIAVPLVAFLNTTVRALRRAPVGPDAREDPDEPGSEPGRSADPTRAGRQNPRRQERPRLRDHLPSGALRRSARTAVHNAADGRPARLVGWDQAMSRPPTAPAGGRRGPVPAPGPAARSGDRGAGRRGRGRRATVARRHGGRHRRQSPARGGGWTGGQGAESTGRRARGS